MARPVHGTTLAMLAILLVAGVAGAAPGAWQPADWVDVSGRIASETTGFFAEFTSGDEAPVSPGLVLQAEWMRIEIDQAWDEVADPAGHDMQYDHWLVYEGPGTVTPHDYTTGYKLRVASHEASAAFEGTQLQAWAASSAEHAFHAGPAAGPDRRIAFAMDDAVRMERVAGTIQLRGDFMVAAFLLDLQIETPSGTFEEWTGYRGYGPSGLEPATMGFGFPLEYRGAIIYVRNGTLIGDFQHDGSTFYAPGYAAAVKGKVGFNLEGDGLLAPSTSMTESGENLLELRRSADGLEARLGPIPTEATPPSAGFAPVPVPEPPAPSGPGPSTISTAPVDSAHTWAWWLGAALLVAVAFLIVHDARRRNWQRIEQAMEVGVYDYVARRSARFVRYRRYRDRAVTMRTVAALHQGEVAGAESFLEGLPPRRQPHQSIREYLLACIAARRGDPVAVRRHVTACLTIEPAYELEVRRNPWLRDTFEEGPDGGYA